LGPLKAAGCRRLPPFAPVWPGLVPQG